MKIKMDHMNGTIEYEAIRMEGENPVLPYLEALRFIENWSSEEKGSIFHFDRTGIFYIPHRDYSDNDFYVGFRVEDGYLIEGCCFYQ